MGKKLRFFFKEKYFSTFIAVAMVAVFIFVLITPTTYAEFLRQTGDEGWGYGYGYGYGIGYGWDSGAVAGYRTEEGSYDTYAYGYGYGYLAGSYDSSTGVTLTSASDLATLYKQGAVTISGAQSAASSITFNDKVTLNLSVSGGTLTVTIPSGAKLTKTGGGNFDFTSFTASDQSSNASGITGQSIKGAVQVGIPTVGLTSSSAITIKIPVSSSLNGQGLNVYRSSSAVDSGYSLLGSCTVASGICSFSTTSLSYFSAATDDGSGDDGDGGDGGGGGGTPVTEEEKQATAKTGDVTIEVSDVIVTNPSDVNEVLSTLGLERNTADEAKYAKLINDDLKEFGVQITDNSQRYAMINFVTYGISPETQKFGSGERRAILRDYLNLVGRADVIWTDIQRMATGQKIVNRNLPKEQEQLPQVLAMFEKAFGHRPNFKDANEDLAWNTFMYRIRFTRNLDQEREGITDFRGIFNRDPKSPLDWSVVRALGYIY